MIGDDVPVELGAYLENLRIEIEAALERTLLAIGGPPIVATAARYALMGGGKRLRPCLTLSVAESVAAALEGRTRLLVFDNCEHVRDAAADLMEAILAQSARASDSRRPQRARWRYRALSRSKWSTRTRSSMTTCRRWTTMPFGAGARPRTSCTAMAWRYSLAMVS